MRFGVLGPVVAEDDHGPVGLRGPRHRAVLARLLIAHRRVVPVRVLVDDLWDHPPDGAVGAIQTFVATLRQAVEPGRPPRTPAKLLVTEGAGYALRAESVDAWRFEAALTEAGKQRAEDALKTLDAALALWRGPAYSEFAEERWARAEVSRLHELRLLAMERRAEAALTLGQAAAVAADLRAHVAEHPWREHGWRLLALSLYQAGRQRDALRALRTAKAALVTELGIDPGPELRQLEADILAQAPGLVPPARSESLLVGRSAELTRLTSAAPSRGLALALVSGDGGAGKTALVEALDTALGWTSAWGRNPEHDDAPAAWPWTQILDKLGYTPSDTEDRFQAHREIVSYVDSLGPLLLVLDDLHRAGEETLALLAALIAEPMIGPVLVVGTFRTSELSPGLTDLLARAARLEPVRIYLGGLAREDAGELVRRIARREASEDVIRTIHERSGGNPFFVRELARLFDAEGDVSAVPAGVRDVIRQRLNALPMPARTVLRQAAVIGREFDLDLLIPLAGNEDLVLDTVDAALHLGFLVEDGPTRFAHVLVRDTLYEEVSQARRARWHATIGDTLEQLRPDDVDALAHHFLLAGNRSAAASRYAAAAAERAERRFAPHEAARLWQAALDRSDAGDVRTRLALMMGRVRALAVTGELAAARTHRADAITVADSLGAPELTARVIGAFDVPGIWTANDDPALSARIVAVTERLLPGRPDAERARLLSTLAMELRGTRSARGREAAAEAESIARRLGDPALLAFALNGRFMHTFDRAGRAPERAAIGRELVALATENHLTVFAVLGHLILVQAHSATAEFTLADQHAAAADDLAARHEIPLVGVFTGWYAALRLAATGRNAEAAYRVAAAKLGGSGMWGMERGILPLALLSLRPSEVDLSADWGPYLPWVLPLGLLAAGDRTGAQAALRAIPESPRDLLLEARTCLVAEAALALDDRPLIERIHTELLPAAGQLAGAGSGLLTFGPVDHYLARLRRSP